MRKISTLIWLCLLAAGTAAAQGGFEAATIPFQDQSGQLLRQPLGGGMNSPMFSQIDLNGDGNADMAVFDRTTDLWQTWIASGTNPVTYTHDPRYESAFPRCRFWALLRDMNCDGRPDLVTTSQFQTSNMRVLFNNAMPGQVPSFVPGVDPVMTESLSVPGTFIPILISEPDRPEIKDIDGDGDLDILFMVFGSNSLEYNKNFSLETGNCGSLTFRKQTNEWGGLFLAGGCGNYGFVGRLPAPGEGKSAQGPTKVMHSGASVTLANLNGDANHDLMLGDFDCTPLYAFNNTGTNASPAFPTAIKNWPRDLDSARMRLFPAGYVVDENADGLEDIFVAPSLIDLSDYNAPFRNTVFLYRNVGTSTAPNYVRTTTAFLQEDMVDVGSAALPTFADYDADGDMDLFIGNQGQAIGGRVRTQLHLYENIGNATAPQFKLVNESYGRFDTLAGSTGYLRVQFRDVNGDGAPDLLFNTSFNVLFVAHRYILNLAPAGAPFNFTGSPIRQWPRQPIGGQRPLLSDFDGDGVDDLVYGTGGGQIDVYKNNGTNAAPSYTLLRANYGNLRAATYDYPRYYADIAIDDIDGNGSPDIALTDDRGILQLYMNYRQQGATFAPADTMAIALGAGQPLQLYHFGRTLSPALADLNGDGLKDLAIGTGTGGVRIFYNRGNWPTSTRKQLSAPVISLYPNPARDQVALTTSKAGQAQLLNVAGQQVLNFHAQTGTNQLPLTAPLPAGLYLLRFTAADGSTTTQKLVIEP